LASNIKNKFCDVLDLFYFFLEKIWKKEGSQHVVFDVGS
jgi:hypothetical protein